MKKISILAIVFSVILFSACSQKNLPDNVKKEFSEKYAAAQSVKWDSETENEWEAEFKMDGKDMSACFDKSGKWLNSETVITEKELPDSVLKTLNTEYEGYKKGLIEIYESPEITGFELALTKGESSVEVIFDSNGKTFKKTEAKEEDEKGEQAEKDEKSEEGEK